MIWIVSKAVSNSDTELLQRLQYINDVTGVAPSKWIEGKSISYGIFQHSSQYYICRTKKGEYGVSITAHIGEVEPILNSILSSKRAIVIVNSCMLNSRTGERIYKLVQSKNRLSELYFAKQEKIKGSDTSRVNYVDKVGDFGFGTTKSERELFMNRSLGLIPAIRASFDKITA